MSLKLHLTVTQFVAIYGILHNVRLGNRNKYETALSELMLDMEHDGAEDFVNKFIDSRATQFPTISIEASDEDGITISVNE